MKLSFLIAALAFALGIGLLIFGASGGADITFIGVTFNPRIAKGAGIVVMIFSVISLLVAYGSSLPPGPADRRREQTPPRRDQPKQ
jgi:hypothetical protein